MTIYEALAQNAKRLSLFSSTPRLDAEVLLAHVTSMSRASLLAHGSDALRPEQAAAYATLIERRAKGEPVAYLTGHKEFYGLDLEVTPAVLVPRPETESVVEACLELLPDSDNGQLADIGTGSGAIIVAVGVKRPRATLYATEISPEALEVARRNIARHGLADRVHLYLGSLLEPLEGVTLDVIAANLPYVPPGEASPEVAAWEPNVAVFGGGEDGTAIMRRFLAEVPEHLKTHGSVVMETAHSQGTQVAELARQALPGARVGVRKDLAGYDRIVIVQT